MRAFELRIENEVESAKSEAERLYSALHYYANEVLVLAEQNFEATSKAYTNGQIGLLSVLKAQDQRLQLESNYLETLYDYEVAKLKLNYARVDEPVLNKDEGGRMKDE